MSFLCLLVAVVIFVLASLGAWPDRLAGDFEPIALGLAFGFASFFPWGSIRS